MGSRPILRLPYKEIKYKKSFRNIIYNAVIIGLRCSIIGLQKVYLSLRKSVLARGTKQLSARISSSFLHRKVVVVSIRAKRNRQLQMMLQRQNEFVNSQYCTKKNKMQDFCAI